MKQVLMISRAAVFSPNSVEKDLAILEAVGTLLHNKGLDVRFVAEEALGVGDSADIYFSMGRLPSTLAVLKRKERAGCVVVNSAYGVERCMRRTVEETMRGIGIPSAKAVGGDTLRLRAAEGSGDTPGYWLKRADASAQEPGDVCFASDAVEAVGLLDGFAGRGISDVWVTEHVPGDVVKFYGVLGTGFFRTYYPTDDGDTKFGDERRNGAARHYAFDARRLEADACRLATALGVTVYGGDCIVRADGSYAVIDFNDWPSFSRCRDEAAAAIARVLQIIK